MRIQGVALGTCDEAMNDREGWQERVGDIRAEAREYDDDYTWKKVIGYFYHHTLQHSKPPIKAEVVVHYLYIYICIYNTY